MTLYILLSPQVSSYLAPGQLELILGHPPPGSRYSRGLSPAADTLRAVSPANNLHFSLNSPNVPTENIKFKK